jgi:predicted HTH domain antitoxin
LKQKLSFCFKLLELGRLGTGMAARLAGMERVAFRLELEKFSLSPIGVDPDDLHDDLANE